MALADISISKFIRRGVSVAVIDTANTEDGVCDCSTYAYAHEMVTMLAEKYNVPFEEIKGRGEP